MVSVKDRIEHVLDEAVRPVLLLHGGGIKTVNLEDGVYRFCLIGQCAHCPSAYLEVEGLVHDALLQAVPEVEKAVLEIGVSQELLDQARAILKG